MLYFHHQSMYPVRKTRGNSDDDLIKLKKKKKKKKIELNAIACRFQELGPSRFFTCLPPAPPIAYRYITILEESRGILHRIRRNRMYARETCHAACHVPDSGPPPPCCYAMGLISAILCGDNNTKDITA